MPKDRYMKNLEEDVAKKVKLTKEGRKARADYRSGEMGGDPASVIRGRAPGNARRTAMNRIGDLREFDGMSDKGESKYLQTGKKLPLTPEGRRVKLAYKAGRLSEDAQGNIRYGPKGKRSLSSNRARREMNRMGKGLDRGDYGI